ncbi:hypothetical protein GALMADRAFT_135421 [Galerina marginata CBS 339.88]|uniref:Uncharacterized protein n=1 Tax=Galerina marginata (strain CBS 339.88) TaxID=685588 RepID=A0A067TFR5_GALM3|nr:hypothetical protein GALMADRAFT_135421 [Galerina marginata CBS 339.88]
MPRRERERSPIPPRSSGGRNRGRGDRDMDSRPHLPSHRVHSPPPRGDGYGRGPVSPERDRDRRFDRNPERERERRPARPTSPPQNDGRERSRSPPPQRVPGEMYRRPDSRRRSGAYRNRLRLLPRREHEKTVEGAEGQGKEMTSIHMDDEGKEMVSAMNYMIGFPSKSSIKRLQGK